MSALGSLVVKLALEYAEWTRGLERGEQDALQFANRVQHHFDEMGESVKGLLSGIAAGIASAFTVDAVISGLGRAVDTMDQLSKASVALDITTDRLAGLKFAAESSGSSFDELYNAINKLAKKAAEGDGVFGRMGVDVNDANGHLKSADRLLEAVADKFASYADGTGKAALAQQLFEESGAKLIPLLNGGAAGLNEMQQQARELGLVFDGQTAAAAEHFNDTLDLAGKALEGIFTQVVAQTLPALQSMADAFLKISASQEGMSESSAILSAVIRGTGSVVLLFASTVHGTGQVIGGFAAGLVEMAAGIKDAFVSVVTDVYEALKSATTAFALVMARNLDGAKEAAGQALEVFGKSGGEAAARVRAGMSVIAESYIDGSKGILSALGEAEKMLSGASNGFSILSSNINKLPPPTKAAADAAKAATDEFGKLISAWSARIAILNADGATTEKLTATQQAYLKLQSDLASSSSKLTAAKKAEVLGFAAAAVQIEASNIATDQAIKLAEEYSRNVEAMLAPLEDRARVAERELQTYGRSESQIEATAIARLNEARGIAAANGALPEHLRFLDREIEARTRLMETAASRALLDQQTEIWRSIDSVGHDTFVSILDAGKDAFERLRDTAKNVLYDFLYQMTIRRWEINIAASISGSGVAGQAFGAAAQSGGIGLGGFGAGLLGSIGAFGAGFGAAGSAVSAVGLGNTLAASGSLIGTGSASGIAAGLGQGLGAIGPYALAAYAGFKLLESSGIFKGATPHRGGAAFSELGGASGLASAINTPGFGLEWGAYRAGGGGDRSATVDQAVAQVIDATAADILARAGRYGATAEGIRIAGKFASDNHDASRGGYAVIGAGGQSLLQLDSKYAKDYQQGFSAFGGDALRAEVAALKSLDLDGYFRKLFDSVDPLTSSLDTLNQVMASADELSGRVAAAHQLQSSLTRDAMEDVRLSGLSAAAAWFESSERIRDAALSGTASIEQLTQFAADHYANEVALLRNIDQVSRSAGQTFADSMRNIQYSVLNSEGKYDFLDKEADKFRDVLKSITDPQEIERYASKLNNTINAAFTLLDPAAQAKYADQFVERLQTAADLTQERLAAAREQVRAEQNSLATQLADAAEKGIDRAVDHMVDGIKSVVASVPRKIGITVTQIHAAAPAIPFARVGVEIGDGG